MFAQASNGEVEALVGCVGGRPVAVLHSVVATCRHWSLEIITSSWSDASVCMSITKSKSSMVVIPFYTEVITVSVVAEVFDTLLPTFPEPFELFSPKSTQQEREGHETQKEPARKRKVAQKNVISGCNERLEIRELEHRTLVRCVHGALLDHALDPRSVRRHQIPIKFPVRAH